MARDSCLVDQRLRATSHERRVTNMMDSTEKYTTIFNEFLANSRTPFWLKDIQSQGMKRFQSLGFPNRKNEEWRYTNIAPITHENFTVGAQFIEPVGLQDTIHEQRDTVFTIPLSLSRKGF